MIENRWALVTALAVVLLTAIALSGCRPATPAAEVEEAGALWPTANNPLVVDREAKEVRVAARVQGEYFTTPTYHAVVWEEGKAGKAPLFQAHVSDRLFYEALRFIGAMPGDNLKLPSPYPESKDGGAIWGEYTKDPQYSQQVVGGDRLQVFVTWQGAPKLYPLAEVVEDPLGAEGRGVEVHFDGNYDYIEVFGSGCLTCLYSCPGGKTSNAAYTPYDYAQHKEAGRAGFTGKANILPPDGTEVVIVYRLGG